MRCIVPALLALLFGSANAATFVVDTTDPDPTGALTFCTPAPEDCSFRGALTLAELDANEDTIQFNIPLNHLGCADGVCSIDLSNGFNWTYINTPIVFDGRTQPGYAANTTPASTGPIGGQPAIRLYNMKNFEFRRSGQMHGLRVANGWIRFSPRALAWTFQGNWFTEGTQIEFIKENYSDGLQDIQFGGLLPEQRNWLSETVRLTFQQGVQGLRLRMEGNLIGTDRTGLQHHGAPGDWSSIMVEKYSPSSDILIGGTDPQARNIFSAELRVEGNPGRVRIEGNHFGIGVDGTSPVGTYVPVLGNGFILGGETPEQGNLIGHAARAHCTVEISQVMYGEGRALILGNRFLDNAGPVAICPGYVFGRARFANDAGDADGGETPSANRLQNAPEISAFDVQGQTVSLTYRVDSLPQYTTWPLRVEFYFTTTDAGEEPLHVDSYAQSDAQQFKSIAFELPEGVTLTRNDVLVATASAPAPGFSTSHFSWYPVMLSFVDNAPLVVGTPTPVKVRVRTLPRAPGQPAWPFTPSGMVRITNSPQYNCDDPPTLGTQAECFATLQPSAEDPTIAVGECALTLPADYAPTTSYIQARYCTRERAFAARDAQNYGMEEPTVDRIADVNPATPVSDDLFCNSFEDNDPGCPGDD